LFADEITPVSIPQRKSEPLIVDQHEHPRPQITPQTLAKLRGINGADMTVTAGNASGVNDGAAALLLGNETMAKTMRLWCVW